MKTEEEIPTRPMTAEEIEKLKPYTKRQTAYLWGKKYRTTPTLVHTVFGDGKQLISLDPAATRPDYFVILADSSIKSMPDAFDFIANNEELVFCAIEEEYGNVDDPEYDDEGNEIEEPEYDQGPDGALRLNTSCGWVAGFYEDFNREAKP